MIHIRRANERGSADHGWLKTHHTFSFGDYYDPRFMGFRSLRVINEDEIAPGTGFPTHGHRDMEIVSYVTQGVLEHRDTLGNRAQIKPGILQKMSAGTGIRHSEYSVSTDQPTRLIQIWIEPSKLSVEPSYAEKDFKQEIAGNKLVLVASPETQNGTIHLHQDAKIWVGKFSTRGELDYNIEKGRHIWIQMIEGSLDLSLDQDRVAQLQRSDGLAVSDEKFLKMKFKEGTEFLLFDLA